MTLIWCKTRLPWLLLWLAEAGLQLLLVFLQHEALRPLFYGLCVCFFLTLCALALDYGRCLRRAHALRDVAVQLPEQLPPLPAPGGTLEPQYQQLLRALFDAYRQNDQLAAQQTRDALDYYNTWLHQIKTPIAAMRLLLQTEEQPPKAALEDELFRIEQYAEMALQNLRLQSETTDYVIVWQDLDEIVRRSVRRFSGQFIRRRIALRYEPISARALTDAKWLGFALEQVLSNALKYTPAGGAVTICAEEQVLIVSDTGIGIAPQDLPRVFDRSFTGRNGREEQRSTGIGLYLCKKILTRLGHTITLDSTPSVGTTVRIDLSCEQSLFE